MVYCSFTYKVAVGWKIVTFFWNSDIVPPSSKDFPDIHTNYTVWIPSEIPT